MTHQPNKFVDSRLARGLAKQLIGEVSAITMKQNKRPAVLKSVKTLSSRKKAIRIAANVLGDLLIDALAFDNYRYARLISLDIATMRQTGQDVLAARVIELDLVDRMDSTLSSRMNGSYNVELLGTICMFSQHSLERFIQRNQVRKVADLVATTRLGAQWSGVAQHMQLDCSFMIPVKDGLICCGMDVPVRSAADRAKGIKGVNIRTFIGLEDMRPSTRHRWERLVDIGAMDKTPRVLKNEATDEHIRIFEAMADEGRKWDARKASWSNKTERLERRLDENTQSTKRSSPTL